MGSIPVRRTFKGSIQQILNCNLSATCPLLPHSLKVRILGFHLMLLSSSGRTREDRERYPVWEPSPL